jgi:hypothetical protein
MPAEFTALSTGEIETEIDVIAREAEAAFGHLTTRQLNWKPAPDRWSVAQCFDHLIRINGLMLDGMAAALDAAVPRSLVQRLPGLPRLFGRVMIRSLSPTVTRRLSAPRAARPSTSELSGDIIQRFAEAQAAMRERLREIQHRDLARTIMVSPFSKVVAYSVLDAWRIITAHERRHFEQARRVTEIPGFPD